MYAQEQLGTEDDDGTMVNNVATLAEAVVGHRIVSAERTTFPGRSYSGEIYEYETFVITLDDGTRVALDNTNDCCAHTDLMAFLLHPERIDHIITGIGTTGGYNTWHIYADMGDVLELTVGWSCGNPFYYGYGFEIRVVPMEES